MCISKFALPIIDAREVKGFRKTSILQCPYTVWYPAWNSFMFQRVPETNNCWNSHSETKHRQNGLTLEYFSPRNIGRECKWGRNFNLSSGTINVLFWDWQYFMPAFHEMSEFGWIDFWNLFIGAPPDILTINEQYSTWPFSWRFLLMLRVRCTSVK